MPENMYIIINGEKCEWKELMFKENPGPMKP